MESGTKLAEQFDAHPVLRFILQVPLAGGIAVWAIWRLVSLFGIPGVSSLWHIVGAILIGALVLLSWNPVFLRAPLSWRTSAFVSLAILAAIAVAPAIGSSVPSKLKAQIAVLGFAFWAAFGLLLLLTSVRAKTWKGNGPWLPADHDASGAVHLCRATFRVIAKGYSADEVDHFLAETRKQLEQNLSVSRESIDNVTFTLTESGYSVSAVDSLLEELSSQL